MKGLTDGILRAMDYIEEHLTDELSMEDIAAQAYVSVFHFQRIFSVLCGCTLGEYIRMRRLTLAAQELSCSDARILDIALKYGYDSNESFTRAFTKFHGISPKAARENGVSLKCFAPLQISLILKGGSMMEYRIVEKAAFTIMGKMRVFSSDHSYQEIPKFWDEHYCTGGGASVGGMFGVCMEGDGSHFEYWIADNYNPCLEIPDGCMTREIPACTWAVFPCKGALPDALQSLNTRIWSEWLPNCRNYALAGNYNIEMYTPRAERPEDTYSEIWIPVRKI